MRYLISALLTLSLLLSGCGKTCPVQSDCELEPDSGLCQAAFIRYYYDKTEKKCKEFLWGGCGTFPFETLEECEVCECNQ